MSFVVTIDGPAAAGKSTTARQVASRLGLLYIDTGSMYRAIALKVLRAHIQPDDTEAVARCAANAVIDLSGSPGHSHVWLDGADVSGAIRTPPVSELSSRLAAQPAVREKLVEVQRALRERGPLVAEGRDLGTVVFPDAEVKIFLDADLDTRAERRCRELHRRGIATRLEEVREDLKRRDDRDRNRATSPLMTATDAITLDTSGLDIEAQVEAVIDAIRRHPHFEA